jgi:hypothetical protein
MLSNCTLDDIKAVRFGTHLQGSHKSFKVRLESVKAEYIYKRIPAEHYSSIKVYVAKNGFTIMVIRDHQNSTVWYYLDNARQRASKLVFGQVELF